MELIGTILYFAEITKDDNEITSLVNTIKPHFEEKTIIDSIGYLKSEGILTK